MALMTLAVWLAAAHCGCGRSLPAPTRHETRAFVDACLNGDLPKVNALLKTRSNRALLDCLEWGLTPLHAAVSTGRLELAEVLIARGADVDKADQLGWAPLHHAACIGDHAMARLLIAHGADLNAQSEEASGIDVPGRGTVPIPEGATPLAVAESCGRSRVARLLRDHGARE